MDYITDFLTFLGLGVPAMLVLLAILALIGGALGKIRDRIFRFDKRSYENDIINRIATVRHYCGFEHPQIADTVDYILEQMDGTSIGISDWRDKMRKKYPPENQRQK